MNSDDFPFLFEESGHHFTARSDGLEIDHRVSLYSGGVRYVRDSSPTPIANCLDLYLLGRGVLFNGNPYVYVYFPLFAVLIGAEREV
jgi:hypothetical protein